MTSWPNVARSNTRTTRSDWIDSRIASSWHSRASASSNVACPALATFRMTALLSVSRRARYTVDLEPTYSRSTDVYPGNGVSASASIEGYSVHRPDRVAVEV